jgi:hypothetical protein
MVKWLFTQNAVKIYCGIFLFTPLISFAQQGYNVVKDNGFENNDTIWRERPGGYGYASRHWGTGYESKWCGITEDYGPGGMVDDVLSRCYLEQNLIKRVARDYESGNNVRFCFKIGGLFYPSDWEYWCLSIGRPQKRLIFLYAGTRAHDLLEENDTLHIVQVDLPTTLDWNLETLTFYPRWVEKFSESDTITDILLMAYGWSGKDAQGYGSRGNQVLWDDIVFESTRPDSDAAVVDIGFSGIPSAKVKNKGAVAVSFPTICDIFKGGNRVYSDTVNVDSLSVDSIKQVNFKPYSDTSEMKVYTALPGDQNPSNDTLSKNLGIQEVAVKKPLEFRVWPALTRGTINYESDKSAAIYDPTGRMMVTVPKGKGSFVLEKAGVYFVKSGREIKKIVQLK